MVCRVAREESREINKICYGHYWFGECTFFKNYLHTKLSMIECRTFVGELSKTHNCSSAPHMLSARLLGMECRAVEWVAPFAPRLCASPQRERLFNHLYTTMTISIKWGFFKSSFLPPIWQFEKLMFLYVNPGQPDDLLTKKLGSVIPSTLSSQAWNLTFGKSDDSGTYPNWEQLCVFLLQIKSTKIFLFI